MLTKIASKYRSGGISAVARSIIGRVVPPRPLPHPVGPALDQITKSSGFTVVQLGAFTGNTTNDPLYGILSKRLRKTSGTLLLVEPVRAYFEQLTKAYQDMPGVAFENAAVADFSGEAEIYRLDVDPVAHGYPEWLAQLSSLKAERVGELWDRYEQNPEYKSFYLQHRVKEAVRCLTFADLLERHGLKHIDLLQIDVEGYELEILRTIDFRRDPIRFVNFENVLLQERKADAERLMRASGYSLIEYGQDTFCYTSQDARLGRRYRRHWVE